MRQIRVTVRGLTPYLMNSITSMEASSSAARQLNYDRDQEALKRLYWTEDKSSLAIPGVAFYRSLIRAGANYTVKGKLKMSAAMVGCVAITPEFLPLNTIKYAIDTQSVLVQKARVIRHRPKIWPWEVTFELHFRDEWIPVPIMAKIGPEVIKTAGVLVGVGDFRPEKKGQFGQYHLIRFELLAQREETSIPQPEIIGFDLSAQLEEASEELSKRTKKKAA
jgi:hypothetical protein